MGCGVTVTVGAGTAWGLHHLPPPPGTPFRGPCALPGPTPRPSGQLPGPTFCHAQPRPPGRSSPLTPGPLTPALAPAGGQALLNLQCYLLSWGDLCPQELEK